MVAKNVIRGISFGLYSGCNVVQYTTGFPPSWVNLQLGIVLGLLEDGLHLGRLHNIALDLELAGHEKALSVGLAGHEVSKIGVGKTKSDCACINTLL